VDGLPLGGMRAAGENDNFLAALLEVAREDPADLAAAASDDDAQWPFCWKASGVH
jgi:hypothetical protein